MSTVIAICKAQPQDAAAIAKCLASAFAPFRSQYTAGAFADTVLSAEGVLDRMTDMTVYAAITPEGEIVGTVATEVMGQVGHLRGMAVRPEWQGHAIAEQLLRAAENDMRAAGCHSMTMDTTAALERAIRFYERNGYAPSGKSFDFFGMPLHEYVKQLRPTQGDTCSPIRP
jgi:ribosomal protein S18 acetylase RimI-like enzyme